jgi:hypothetical protein
VHFDFFLDCFCVCVHILTVEQDLVVRTEWADLSAERDVEIESDVTETIWKVWGSFLEDIGLILAGNEKTVKPSHPQEAWFQDQDSYYGLTKSMR